MSRPSEPLLAWLRKLLQERGLNSAALAERAGLPRSRTRQILSGKQDMSVDELLSISKALELSPADMGVPMDDEAADEPEEATQDEPYATLGKPTLAPALDDDEEDDDEPYTPSISVDPYDTHHRQLLEVAFALGCDVAFTCDTKMLQDSNVPKAVLNDHPEHMMIRLEARYHQYNDPKYTDDGVTITLSFDALYNCTFPWTSFKQVIFTPLIIEPEVEDPTPGGHLRLLS
ncbi:MAG: helix-turn-helix domain-containing protein [Rhodobacterales bacterium]|nr:helix-turn-helix domain-containing protein [Rhodobacterales bacterium]